MKVKNSRWMIVVGVVMAFLVLGTIVWASPPVSTPSAPLQATPGFDADLLDGHDSAYSAAATNAERANKLLWASPNGRLSIRSMPLSQLNNRYVFKAVANTIQAATAGTLLTVNNTGTGVAVRGISASHDGVVGETSVAGRSGVYGYNSGSGLGVTGRSANDFGVYAWGKDTSSADRQGDLLLQGTRGEIWSMGTVMNLLSDGNVQIYLDSDDNYSNAWLGVWNGTSVNVLKVEEDGDLWAKGRLMAGGTKPAVVETESYDERLLYAMESPQVWFEDFGSASLVDGVVTVAIEPIFAETVNLGEEYHVFLTPLGDCNGLYVAAKTPTSFEVRELGGGTASIAFDYRIVAKRLGYEDVRLETPPPSSSPDGT